MPHFHIDCSPNLVPRLEVHGLDLQGLCRVVAEAAAKTGLFPLAGIRVRVAVADAYHIADGNPGHAYLDLSVRLRAGREVLAKQAATAAIFAALETYCAPIMATSSFMLSMEMRDIDAALSPKASSIRSYLPKEML
ncbi:MAG: 5-carboxymethyl-2-hydroxymuconate isomerase [Microgenomates group bacterium]